MSYNELCDLVAEQHDREARLREVSGDGTTDDLLYTFRNITAHQGPLMPQHRDYKGSKFNVEVEWEDGTKTWEPLAAMIKNDPATLASYAKEHDLLDVPGWKQLKRIARRAKVLQRMVNASK